MCNNLPSDLCDNSLSLNMIKRNSKWIFLTVTILIIRIITQYYFYNYYYTCKNVARTKS